MVRSNSSRVLVLLASLIAAVWSGAAANGPVVIAVPSRANANPSISANGQFVALTWSVATQQGFADIYVSASRDGGRSFSAPAQVNRTPGDANVSGEQPPRIALVPRNGGEPSIVVVWTAKDPSGTRLQSARSDDGGHSFAQPARVPGSESGGNRGWESIATTRDGDVVAMWLDHRELARSGTSATMQHGEHRHEASAGSKTDGAARAQLSQLFFGRLSGNDRARAITGGVCYCCKTSVATGADGSIYAAWRHVYPGNVRDIAFTMSSDGGRTFATPLRVSDDQWIIDGCPENGPALAVDGGRRIHVVWPTLVPGATPASEPTLALFYAASSDGRTFTTRQRIPTQGFPRHPQMAIDAHGALIAVWDEQAPGIRRIAMARAPMTGKGNTQFVRTPIPGGGSSASYPVVAVVGSEAVVAWVSGPAGRTAIRSERLAF